MEVQKKPIVYQDERGTILDVLESINFNGATVITSNAGSVRGCHFHKKTIQYAFILEGKILAKSKIVGMDLESVILEPGDLVIHDIKEAHLFEAIEDSKFIVFSSGLRTGRDYELDTYRLKCAIEDFSEFDMI